MKRSEIIWDDHVLTLAGDLSSEISQLLCPEDRIDMGLVVLSKTYDCGINVKILATLPTITFWIDGANQRLVTEFSDYVRHSARSLGTDTNLKIEVNPEERYLDPLE